MKHMTLSTIRSMRDYVNQNKEKIWFILDDQIIEIPNISKTPDKSFKIPFDLLGDYQKRLKGTIHSHTSGSANLSIPDFETFKNLPNMLHFIITTDDVRAYLSKGRRIYNASETEISRFFEGTLF